MDDVCRRLKLSPAELREDIDVLNVVNFGGGTYVLYAEIDGNEIEVDSEPYEGQLRPPRPPAASGGEGAGRRDRPLRGPPAAGGAAQCPREDRRGPRTRSLRGDLEIAPGGGDDADVARVVNEAIASRRVLELNYYKENEDQFTKRRVEPYRLENGREGWYVDATTSARARCGTSSSTG